MTSKGEHLESERKRSLARLLIVDDDALARRAIKSVLSREPDLVVAGESRIGREALRLCRELRPHLVLFSFQTNETDNCEGLEELLTGCRGTRVLALVDNVDEDVLLKVVRCGASGYVLTNGDSDQLLTAVRQTLGGNNPLDREVAMRLLRRLVGEAGSEHMRSSTPGSGAKESAGEEKAVFTPRELVVLNGLVEGKTNRQIARNLHVSLSTVKRHVERILPKLGVSDRTQAAVRAVQLDLLPTRKD